MFQASSTSNFLVEAHAAPRVTIVLLLVVIIISNVDFSLLPSISRTPAKRSWFSPRHLSLLVSSEGISITPALFVVLKES